MTLSWKSNKGKIIKKLNLGKHTNSKNGLSKWVTRQPHLGKNCQSLLGLLEMTKSHPLIHYFWWRIVSLWNCHFWSIMRWCNFCTTAFKLDYTTNV